MSDVIVLDYNPEWPKAFEVLQHFLASHLKDYAITIEHVGSTSIVDLPAKPILDVDIIMHNPSQQDGILNVLATLGYTCIGDLGIVGRLAFKKASDATPFTETNKLPFAHNLYVCEVGCMALENHLALRDYLRQHPGKRDAYGHLKKELSKRFPDNVDDYCEAKTDFITDLLLEAGLSAHAVDDIATQNKTDESL